MAKPSLAQFCASYKIDSKNLERVYRKIGHASSLLHIFSCWVENFFPYPVDLNEVEHIQNIVLLLTDLVNDAGDQLEQLSESQLPSISN